MEIAINKALKGIIDPVSGLNFVESGLIADVSLKGSNLRIIIEKPISHTNDLAREREQITSELTKIKGIDSVSILVTTHNENAKPSANQAQKPRPNFNSIRPEGIGKLIAIASGKGGVGKSTIAVNIALALARAGKKVGILDADIYGPSIPTLMGLQGFQCDSDDSGKIIPAKGHGICAMSMGFLVAKDQPLAWRGPMVTKALTQLFQGVTWGELDYLILDMPPGTGDVQLSLAQQARIDGAILVSTPQEVALSDVRRGIVMFQKSGIEIIGVIENMSLLKDENTGLEIDLYGRGGAAKMAKDLALPFLGEVYFYPILQKSSDIGNTTPDVAKDQFDSIIQQI